ncbi:hypothetical protein BGW42_008106 [Actinomortierella wolfii]|nr:hypothetical protein BGW42_008106 [Actinomortierella wolfii]
MCFSRATPAADTSIATRATHINSHATNQMASSAQSLAGIVPSSAPGSSSPHAGQTGSQRTQKQRPILPFANPHVSRARSTSCSSSSSSTSRPPIPPPSQPAMASLSQGPTRNHPGRSNGPRRASYSHDPSNSNTSRNNRPPSPLPLIITLSSSSIRARKNALEMDNIQRASLLYSDFMTRIKESLNRPTHCSHQGVTSADGIQSTQGTGIDEATVTSACSSTTAAPAIATTYLDSIHSGGHEGAQNSECIANIPPPTIGFDPTAEATVALEDLAKTGMLHAMIQRYFEWVHPQFMIFNKNHFLLRFWSQYGPFPEARELNAKLQHALKQDNADEPSDDVSFLATGRSLGFLGERTCPLSPLLLWSMVALVARHIDDRENLKLPIQESQKRVREELALLNLADKETSQRKQQQKSNEIDDVMMAENRIHHDGSESPTAIGANRTPENYKDRGEQYFRWATELLKEQHAESSLAVVQSLLLLHEYAVMAGLNSQASMYAGTAITMAMDLGWHKIKRHVPDNVAAAATSSTTATSIPSSESTTSITTMGSISADPPGFSRSATPSSNNTSSESMTSSTTTTATGSLLLSDPPEGPSSTTSATSAVTTAKFQAATAAVVANPAMVATVTPSSSATVGQTKGKQVMEEEQRLCWGMCFIIDRWAAISAGRPFAIPIHVVDKSVFLTNLTPTAQQQKPKDDADSRSPMVKMPGLQMRTKIFYEQQCRQALVIDEIQQFLMTWTEDLFVNTNSFDRLAMALDNWYRALPPWLTLSNSNGSISIPTPSADVNKPAINQDQQGETASSLPDIMRGIDWVGSSRGPEVKQLEALNKDIPLAILMDISYHTIRILLHRPFLRTNLRHPPCSPTRASFACAQSANAITGYAEQLLNHTVLSPSLLMRHLFIILTAAGIQLTNANLEDEPRLSTPAKINLLKSIRILRDSDCTSIGHERFMAILEEFFPNQMKVMYKRA